MKVCPTCECEHTDMSRYCSDECREAHQGRHLARLDDDLNDLRHDDEPSADVRGQGSRSLGQFISGRSGHVPNSVICHTNS